MKAADPVNKIWYPQVAAATLESTLRASRTAISKVPAPTPRVPWTKPAPNPPKMILKKTV